MDISKFEKVRFKLYLDFQLVIHSNLLFLKLGIVNQLPWWQRREIRFLDRWKMHFQPQNPFSNALPTAKPFFKCTSNHKTAFSNARLTTKPFFKQILHYWRIMVSLKKYTECSRVLSSPDLCRQFGRRERKVWFKETKKATLYAKNFTSL